MIVMLLIDFYSDDDIASAKNILFQTAFNDRDAPRLIKRKGKDKSLNNRQDILNIFLEMPPQSVPCYVGIVSPSAVNNELFIYYCSHCLQQNIYHVPLL